MMQFYFTFLLTLCILSASALEDCGERYRSNISDDFIEYRDVQYGFNYDNRNVPVNLLMDIYTPSEDTATMRPLIILVHGGSFVGGNKRAGEHARIARDLAKMGYVTAAINYRVQRTVVELPSILDFANRSEWYRAITRAAADVKASVRYMKRQVAENGNPYGIDTNNIILYGSSAGAISILHAVYLTDPDDALPVHKAAIMDLGGLEGDSGNPGYGSTNGIRGVIAVSGALAERRWIGNRPDVAFQALHHTADPTVPFGYGCFVTAACHLGRFYGSSPLSNEATALELNHELHFISGVGHPADDQEPDFVRPRVINFLYQLQCAYEPRISTPVMNQESRNVQVFPNPVKGTFNISLPEAFQNQMITTEIYQMNGALIRSRIENAGAVMQISEQLPAGTYLLSMRTSDQKKAPLTAKFVVIP